ncbi:hypothetical protein CLV74_103164 [Donghicola tyrosinivorans]|uniref:Uncharacterized protein n=1 Tax=Donghicola tyrosinivorans TaxID=1652492 RepID=A0A2T0WY14_9RHOB|nr:hypothetical protein CLV74_103164 [Donghicola tyrosinivorans]
MTVPTGQKGRTYPSRVWEHVGKRGLAKVFGRTPFVFQKIVSTAPMMAQPKVAYPPLISVSLNGRDS